jgi:ABC-type multidrug transport system ATPase subunit
MIYGLPKEKIKKGIAEALTTHYMEEADSRASRVGIVDQGRLLS